MKKLYFIALWMLIDPIYYWLSRLTYIGQTPATNIFRVRLTRYKGNSLTLSDGTFIKTNDTLLKIHLHNVQLLKNIRNHKSDIKRALYIYHCVERSLPDLRYFLMHHPQFEQIKGIIGITMLNRGCRRLGFEPVNIANRWYRAFKWMTQLPIYYLSVSTPSFQHIKKHQPCYLFMSKETLLTKGQLRET